MKKMITALAFLVLTTLYLGSSAAFASPSVATGIRPRPMQALAQFKAKDTFHNRMYVNASSGWDDSTG